MKGFKIPIPMINGETSKILKKIGFTGISASAKTIEGYRRNGSKPPISYFPKDTTTVRYVTVVNNFTSGCILCMTVSFLARSSRILILYREFIILDIFTIRSIFLIQGSANSPPIDYSTLRFIFPSFCQTYA